MINKPAQSFKDLKVWQKSHQFVLDVYKMSENFPKKEVYGLTSQLRRAAVSIAANIAEGFRKRTDKDKARYYNISQGSLEECHYYLILCDDLQYSETEELISNLMEVSKMLRAYRKKILNS